MLTPPATVEAIRQAIRDEINYDRRNYITPSTFEGRMLGAVLAAITPDADARTREVAAELHRRTIWPELQHSFAPELNRLADDAELPAELLNGPRSADVLKAHERPRREQFEASRHAWAQMLEETFTAAQQAINAIRDASSTENHQPMKDTTYTLGEARIGAAAIAAIEQLDDDYKARKHAVLAGQHAIDKIRAAIADFGHDATPPTP